jgi:hypothetical protein
MKTVIVVNRSGVEIDYRVAVALMDDQLREQIHAEQEAFTEQEFFECYEAAHLERFGAHWELSKENPVY